MKRFIALTLVLAFSLALFAPLPVFAGGRHRGGVSSGTAAAIGLGALAIGLWAGHAGQPYSPVYGPQPVYVPPMYPMYRTPPTCVGTLTQEYGWQADPYGGPPRYVPTGRTFCNGQILY